MSVLRRVIDGRHAFIIMTRCLDYQNRAIYLAHVAGGKFTKLVPFEIDCAHKPLWLLVPLAGAKPKVEYRHAAIPGLAPVVNVPESDVPEALASCGDASAICS